MCYCEKKNKYKVTMLSNTEQVFIILCLSPWQFYHPPKSRQQFAANIKRAAAAFLEIPDFWTVRINLSQFAKPVVVFGGLAPRHVLTKFRVRAGGAKGNQMYFNNV